MVVFFLIPTHFLLHLYVEGTSPLLSFVHPFAMKFLASYVLNVTSAEFLYTVHTYTRQSYIESATALSNNIYIYRVQDQ